MLQADRTSPGLVKLTGRVSGLITANGGFLSKHAAGVYSCVPYERTHPDASAWGRPDPATYQQTLDAGPEAAVSEAPDGLGEVLTYTVTHNAKGMYRAMVRRGAVSLGGHCAPRPRLTRPHTMLWRYLHHVQGA